MLLSLFLLPLAYVCGQLQDSWGRHRLHYFEADDYVQEGKEWSMWFVPAESSAISSVRLSNHAFFRGLLLSCTYSPEAPPRIELSFRCPVGCMSTFCAPNDTFGLRIDDNVWHVYVRNATRELEATYILQIEFFGNYSDVVYHTRRLVVTKPPKIRPEDITCSIRHFENALRSPSAEILEEKHFRRTINKDPLTEGEWITGEVLLSLGEPKGNVGVYIVKLVRNVSEPELLTCHYNLGVWNAHRDIPNPAKLTFRCLLTVEHVGMVIVAANPLKKGYTTERALQTVKKAILNSVTPWLTKKAREIPEIEGIYGVAHRLVQLFVGWPAVVSKWSMAKIICSLPDERIISVDCVRVRALSGANRGSRLEQFYTYIYHGERYLVMQNYNAQYNDSGVYSCTAARCDRKLGCIVRPVCTDRRLYVCPPTPEFETYLAYEFHWSFENFSRRLYTYDTYNPIDVYAGRNFTLLCSVFRNTTIRGTAMTLKYTHYDPVTNIPTELKVVKLKETTYWGSDKRDRIHKYYLLGDQPMPMYAGRQVAECQVKYLSENAKLPSWMIDPNDIEGNHRLRILGSRSVELRFHQAATGTLQFESETPYFEEHPVPLGTRIRCKGGTGFPLLQHSWSLLSPGRYYTDDPYKQYASSLPLQHGGYELSQQVFKDVDGFRWPHLIYGDTVVIPYDNSLRGMSFLLRCEGTNTDFRYNTHKIYRLLHLTVCICPVRMNVIDISMIVSSQLLPSVKMEGHGDETEEIDFYGKRYLTLLRQIILGLPQSSELARISIVPTTILGDLKRHPLYRKALDFRHNLTRFQLVEGLISENIRPASVFISRNSCPYKYPVRMDEAIRAIPETFSPLRSREERKRPHIILYPMDPWNKIDSPSVALQILKKLQSEGSKLVLVYFFNKSHSEWKDTNHGLSSIYNVELMPQSKYGGKKCYSMPEYEEAGLIDRLAMFKTICNMARWVSIKGASTPGFLYFSIPYRMQLLSAKLTISCMSRLDPFEAYKRQMRLCLVNYDAVRAYKLGRSSVEDLDKTCIKHLLTTDFSKPEDSCISLHYEMVLDDSHNGLFAVCYRRTRDMAKLPRHSVKAEDSGPLQDLRTRDHALPFQLPHSKETAELKMIMLSGLFDVDCTPLRPLTQRHQHSDRELNVDFPRNCTSEELASFAIRPIRLTSIPLADPVLVIVHWPGKSGDSAEFQCVVDVSIPPFQVDLVYNPNGTLKFTVVVRQMTAFTLGQINRKGSVRLIWRNLPSNAGNADLFCLISRPAIKARYFNSLPNSTASLKISKPIRRPFVGGCPQAPVIRRLFSRPLSDEPAAPQLGNRMSLICEAETGMEDAPMQMAYADNETRFVICSGADHDVTGEVSTALEIPLACWFADWTKGGCFNQPNAMYSNHELANFTACRVKRKPQFYSVTRTIEFVIPLLRIEHFGGFAFCETVPRKYVGKGLQAEKRLLSEALENYFDVEPQVVSMDVSLLGWRCLVMACPPAVETTLETIVAQPQSLRKALAEADLKTSYDRKSIKWLMSKEAATFFPTTYLASLNESNSSMPFIVSLYRAPPDPALTAEGGLATVECSVTQDYEDSPRTATKRIHISYPRSSQTTRGPSGTTLIPSAGVVEPKSSWGIRCSLTSIFSSTVLYMYLLYKAELGPLKFIGIPLIRVKLQTDVDLGKRVRIESFRPVGLWMKKPLEDLTVTLLSSGGNNVIEITIANAKVSFYFSCMLPSPPTSLPFLFSAIYRSPTGLL
ncbi:unnamed protein product [Schistocephalus solidus]|uniref:Ig-like domain-containing protein n=1 Tax=Schistocephalus solidus TaxID=70667 RepID=A0A183SFM3_SCHSO|nr:unnamed protein product [Schistocephalus solidus]